MPLIFEKGEKTLFAAYPSKINCNSEQAHRKQRVSEERMFAGSWFCIISSDEVIGIFLLLSF